MRGHGAALLAVALCACAPAVQRAGISTVWHASPNFDARRPNVVVIHHTGSATVERALQVLADPAREVSAHYLIGRDGTIFQMVDERARAWHAGASQWGNDNDINSASLGIELDNDGAEPFAEAQIDALLELLGDIRARYDIAPWNYIGHADVAPRRKVDPSSHFPWRRLAQHGFGLWCDAPHAPPTVPLDDVAGLHALGYDTLEVAAAQRAFKRHYRPEAHEQPWDETDRALLACLLSRKTAWP